MNGCGVVISFLGGLYVGLFRNASFIHDYASFYLSAPLAVMGGIGLDGIVKWQKDYHRLSNAMAICIFAVIGWFGFQKAQELAEPAYLLEYAKREPAQLIPELGRFINQEFAPGTDVYCNYPDGIPGENNSVWAGPALVRAGLPRRQS